MNNRALVSIVLAAAIAFARPIAFIAQEAGKTAQILADARKAIGRLDSLKTFSVQSNVQHNVGGMQIPSEVEILLELPDKYLRSDVMNAGPGMIIHGGGTMGFNGNKPIQKMDGAGMPAGGGLQIRVMGPNGPVTSGPAEKPTPEEIEERKRAMVRSSQTEASRLMLGWFAMAHPVMKAEYSYAGEAESADGRAYVIDVKSTDAFAARLFIDEESHLPLMVTYRAPLPRIVTRTNGGDGGAPADLEKELKTAAAQPPEMGDYTIYFEEWRDVEGVKFPFKMRRAVSGTTNEEWTVNKVKVNPKIDPKKFNGDS